MLHRQARAAQILIQELSRHVGSVPGGSSIHPHCAGTSVVSFQHSSACGQQQDPSTPVLEWLIFTIANFPGINFNGGLVEAGEAAMIGWTSLRAAMRSWGITTEQDLSAWLRRQAFPGAEVCLFAARVAMLEEVFVTTTLEFGRQTILAREQPNEGSSCTRPGKITTRPHHSQFGFLRRHGFGGVVRRVPMLKSCPYFFRGRLRNSFRVALEERHRAEGEGVELGEERAWKHFALVPRMLMHRVQGSGSVGRTLCERRTLGAGGGTCWRQPGIPFPLEHRRASRPGARRNEEAWQPRSACRRARSHKPGRNWSVRHWLLKTRRV